MKTFSFGITFAIMISILPGSSFAGLILANFTGKITSVQGDISLFDTWSNIASTDVVLNKTISGQILLDTSLTPGDSAGDSLRFESRANFPVIGDVVNRFLTTSLTIGSQTFSPATELRPNGAQTPNSVPGQSSNANQWVDRVGEFQSDQVRFFDDWDTEFDGVLHDRQLSIELFKFLGIFQDALPGIGTDFSGYTGGGSLYVRAGSEDLLDPGQTSVGGFQFELDSFSNFAPLLPVPEPTSLAIFGTICLLGCGRRRRS